MTASKILEYEDVILDRIEKEKLLSDGERGLADYLDDDTLGKKVHSIHLSIEEQNHELWGVTEVQTHSELSPAEYDKLSLVMVRVRASSSEKSRWMMASCSPIILCV